MCWMMDQKENMSDTREWIPLPDYCQSREPQNEIDALKTTISDLDCAILDSANATPGKMNKQKLNFGGSRREFRLR